MNAPDQGLAADISFHLKNTAMVLPERASPRDLYLALAHSVRDRLVDRWQRTQAAYARGGTKEVHYLSAEFLLGRSLAQNLIAIDAFDEARDIFAAHGMDLADTLERERDPGLGNGGLGRLAACFLESMATLGLPGFGQGIRYEFGIFEQRLVNGQQVEHGDDWLRYGNVWEVARPDERVIVRYYGRVEHHGHGPTFESRWEGAKEIWGIPYDMPIAGYGTDHVNTLRLWSAQPTSGFDLGVFNAGDYRQATAERTLVEAISKVLYPADHTAEGRELRLKQQAFFCTCAIAHLLRRFDTKSEDLTDLPKLAAIQLNDTHPAVAVAELMRVLVDQRRVPWTRAWELTQATVSYTNHTLMPEALERWPADMFAHLLPRHYEIIAEIDRRFAIEVQTRWPDEPTRLDAVRIIQPGSPPQVRMANLATVGSHTINGVAKLHSELIKTRLLPDFAELYPERFTNRTNGVTPRRWVRGCNPALSALLDETVGPDWTRDLALVRGIEPHLQHRAFRDRLGAIKRDNKQRLGTHLHRRLERRFDPTALFDIQIKRMHEYKRQLLCGLHVISRYLRLEDGEDLPPRVVLFGGKAAPGYAMAKHHIHLLSDITATLAADPRTRRRLEMAFVPNYSVSWAELLIPGADLSEQISMAGKEASGTGNMKFAMNGALTIGTLDGANVEIRDAVGPDHFFLFGHTAPQVLQLKASGYAPASYIEASPMLQRVLEALESGRFSADDPKRYEHLVQGLRHRDEWLVCADFDDYLRAQDRVDARWGDPDGWNRSAGLNIARSGRFSSDRTIDEYATGIWGIAPQEVQP